MTKPGNLYWDTCNFIRYLSGSSDMNFYDDISLIIEETKGKSPKWKIHFSTIAYTEIRPEFIKQGGYADIEEFFEDLGSAFTPIDTNPNILKAAGVLRGLKASDKSDPSRPSKRVFGTADAIHLETCLYLRDVLEVEDVIFQSLDEGKGTSWEGKCLPLIGIEDWFPPSNRPPLAKRICDMRREFPKHPEPTMSGIIQYDRAANAKKGA